MKKTTILIMLLAMVCLLSWGCPKRVEEAPPEPDPETVEEKELTEEEKARLEEERQREEMERHALRERELQEERLTLEEMEEKERTEQELREAVQDITDTRIHFAFDKHNLRPDARATLERIGEQMKKFPDLRLVIEGHTDERGTAEYNLGLGERRARSAYEYLVLLGVEAERMQIVSYGEERPLVDESNEEAWAQNRRAEFKVLQ